MSFSGTLQSLLEAAWTRNGRLAHGLAPIARLAGLVAARRMRRRPRGGVEVPVIAVGNFTVGGAGKTPTVAALVRLVLAAGRRPAVVTRGHGGRLAGPVRVDLGLHDAAAVGDEALLHAAVAPTYVARDRLAGARAAVADGAEVVLLDDGFQNPNLAKDFRLVVVDRAAGLGNGRMLPAGPLRAPLGTQLALADALVVVDTGEAEHPSTTALLAEAGRRDLPVFAAKFVAREPELVSGRRVIAFAGIGRPAKFAATLTASGADVVDLVPFPDHHPFTAEDATDLLARAAGVDADPVTTEKDAARFGEAPDGALGRLAAVTRVFAVDLAFDDTAGLVATLQAVIARRRSGAA